VTHGQSTDSGSSARQAIILAHYRDKRFRNVNDVVGVLQVRQTRTCGDEVSIHMLCTEHSISYIGFSGDGCSVSIASASIACHALSGQPVAQARQTVSSVLRFLEEIEKGQPVSEQGIPEDMKAFIDLSSYPTRIACARLAWTAAAKLLEPGEFGD